VPSVEWPGLSAAAMGRIGVQTAAVDTWAAAAAAVAEVAAAALVTQVGTNTPPVAVAEADSWDLAAGTRLRWWTHIQRRYRRDSRSGGG